MARDFLTDTEVEIEIKRLQNSEAVKLAKAEERIRCRRRQMMYTLRYYEKKGKEMLDKGITLENLEEQFESEDESNN